MNKILDGLRVIEGAAFVAAPLCGMTLGQMGADVIRFDPIEGGLDARRWPVTRDGRSLYWAGLNKGKRSIAVSFGSRTSTSTTRPCLSPCATSCGVRSRTPLPD